MTQQPPSEEQEMEAEALTAIFDSLFTPHTPTEWQIDLYPILGADDDEREQLNHVAIQLLVNLPPDYPEHAIPTIRIQLVKGLAADEHLEILQQLANEEAHANLGGPSIFAICERLKDWLVEHNVKGLDDVSMHAQMMKRNNKLLQEQEQKQKSLAAFESQTTHEEMTEAEQEELAVRKRREEGTPCTEENFLVWKQKFEAEMAEKENTANGSNNNAAMTVEKSKAKDTDRGAPPRMTGFEFFNSKAGNVDALEKLEAAAEEAERETTPIDEGEEYDEELFEEDVDLDDLDFDDDEEDDDEDEEVDI